MGVVHFEIGVQCVHCGYNLEDNKLIEAKEERFKSVYKVACGKPHDWHGRSPLRFMLIRTMKRKLDISEISAINELARREWCSRAINVSATDKLGCKIIVFTELIEEDDKMAVDTYVVMLHDTGHLDHWPITVKIERLLDVAILKTEEVKP